MSINNVGLLHRARDVIFLRQVRTCICYLENYNEQINVDMHFNSYIYSFIVSQHFNVNEVHEKIWNKLISA